MSKFTLFESNYIPAGAPHRPAIRMQVRRQLGPKAFAIVVGGWFALAFTVGVLALTL
jgi:hypothetical protein